MVGITSYGAYIPKYRLAREVIANAWGNRFSTGERAVANHDEDSITMATEATIHCLSGINPRTVEGLFFASTTSPYMEKQASTLVATAADLPAEVFTADYSSSLPPGGYGRDQGRSGCPQRRRSPKYAGLLRGFPEERTRIGFGTILWRWSGGFGD